MSTETSLHSIRRLLAFACVLLSLVVTGVGEIAYRVTEYDGTWSLLVLVGFLAACLSAGWFLYLLATGPPVLGGRSNPAGRDGEAGHGDE